MSPTSARVPLTVGETAEFEVRAESPAGLPLEITFTVNGAARATGTTFAFEPDEPGDYRVEAIASDGERETRRAWTVEVEAPADPGPSPNIAPTVVLSVDPSSGTAPLSVRIRLGGSDPDGSVVRYRLEIEGEEAVERAAPIDTTVVFEEGIHAITGIVEDDDGETTDSDGQVSVGPPPNETPVPALDVEPTAGMAPLDVQIDGSGADSDGSIVRYALDLDGDGDFDVESPNPISRSVRYEEAGQVWVRLEVIDDRGAVARDSVRVRVSAVDPPPNQAPTVALDVTPESGEAPLEVQATITGDDPDGSVASIEIDFDGDGAADASTGGSSLSADFTYDQPGTYLARATVVDDGGLSAATEVEITVTEPDDPGDPGDPGDDNTAPTGSLSADLTDGDATLSVVLSGTGSDSDGEIVRWEVDDDAGQGFVEVPDGRLEAHYAYRSTPYRPRLRVTDDDGASTIVEGPPITVSRPVSGSRSATSRTGNPRFDSTGIAPAIWADGEDEMRFTVIVRDHEGNPLPDVPVRVGSLRPELVAPDGTELGGTVTIALDGTRTDGQGRITGSLTTRTSTRVEAGPPVGQFRPFRLMVEADAGHGEWRRLPDVADLNAETIVDGNYLVGQFYVKPGGLTCVGDPLEIHARALRRDDAPGGGGPADGRYTEIRLKIGDDFLDVTPLSGYGSWRTDSDGWIRFAYTPDEPSNQTLQAWVDGQPLNITTALAATDC